MKYLLLFITQILILSCNSTIKRDYEVDQIMIVGSDCVPILDNRSDSGFGFCPRIAVSIEKGLKYYCTKGSVTTSKLDCYNGAISPSIWDSIYYGFITKLLNDTNNYDFKTYLQKIQSGEIVDLSNDNIFLILLFNNNTNVKTIRYWNHDDPRYIDFYNAMIEIENKIKLSTMKDTALIDLSNYTLMPPPLASDEMQVKYKVK